MSTSAIGQIPERLIGWRAGAVWLVVGVDLLLVLGLVFTPEFPVIFVPLILAVVGAFGIVGAILATRLPRNSISWIMWVTATVAAVSIVGGTYATESAVAFAGGLPGTVAVAFIAQVDIIPTLGAVGALLPLLFPDGHLPSPRWRGVARLSAVAIVFSTAITAVTPGTMGGGGIANPLGISALAGSTDVLGFLVATSLGIPCAIAIASVFVRYRGADRLQRQQLKLLGWAVAVFLVLQLIGSSNIGPMADIGWLLEVGSLGLIPIVIGIAILRYRLYEIDRFISRTISWAVTSGVIVAVFAAAVVGLQGILAQVTGGNTVAVAGSTLVAAALFQPIRRQVQEAVDRRFDRARYDAQRTVDAFGEHLRNEVDLPRLRAALFTTADRAVRPLAAGVWLRGGAEGR